MSGPELTLRPADKMTTEDWQAERAERCRKDELYDRLATRLKRLDARVRCGSCDRYIDPTPSALCGVCRGWALAAVKRLVDKEATRRLRVQLAATEALELLNRAVLSDLVSGEPVALAPAENAERYMEMEMTLALVTWH